MTVKECSPITSKASSERAKKERPDILYAGVPVKVIASAGGLVTLEASVEEGGVRTIQVQWGGNEVWSDCPSQISLDSSGAPIVDLHGFLYLSASCLVANNLGWRPKWPDGLPDKSSYQPLEILPTRLNLTGFELRSGDLVEATVNLLDANLASQDQTIVLEPGRIKVALSDTAFRSFFQVFPKFGELERAVKLILESDKKASRDPKELVQAWQQVAAWSSRLEREEESVREQFSKEQSLLDRVLKK